MKRGKKSYADKKLAAMQSELATLKEVHETTWASIRKLNELLADFERTCKLLDSFSGEWEKETRYIKEHANERLYFGRHLYPELMISELKYLSEDVQRMINVHERHIDDFIREHQDSLAL